MNLWFLPYVREGFRPSGDGFSAAVPWRAQARVNTRVAATGMSAHDAITRFDLLGPGDIVGIDTAQVLRVSPARSTNRAEPEFFPCVELDAPDLPWAYSLAAPSANRLFPWICLIVVEEQAGVTLRPGARGQSPWILGLDAALAAHELPDLSEAWAWAHVQVTCDTQAQIADTLANQPDRTLSRLLSPRRLLPQRRYLGCIVPTYLAGRIAGLGGDPEASAAQIVRNLAWSSSNVPTELPVYFTWSFSTGEAGDVESMLRRLQAAPVRADAQRELNVRVASGDAPVVVDWQPPLRVPQQSTTDPRPPAVVAGIRAALAPAPGDGPVVGPPYLGEPWVPGRPLDPITSWVPALNLTPMSRAAAGLGADVIRDHQEELVAAVWEQFTAYQQEDRRQRSLQLSRALENQVKDRLLGAPLEEASRVLGPVVAQATRDAKSVGLRTAVGRRVTARSWRISGGTAMAQPVTARGFTGLPLPASPLITAAGSNAPLAAAPSDLTAPPPPLADTRALLTKDDMSYQGNRFAPRLPTPLSEIFGARFRDLLLPSTAQIAPDSLLAVEVDRGFVEAFLVGANQELNRELLWRGVPADRRATAFRRFWNRTDPGDDIPAIADWPASKALGDNAAPMDAGVLLRSEIVHRCPSLLVAAVPGVWGSDHKRRPSSDARAVRLPVIRTLVGDDLLYVGFAGLTLTDLVGQSSPTGPAGWFLMLAENPVDPRFGLDPPVNPAPTPARGNLSWSNVRMAAGDAYARASGLPAIPGIGFSFATANSALIAYAVQQRQFRAFLHASALIHQGK
jgi:hypothetical protein